MKISVFHPGTQHSWQTALALQQLGKLDSFTTSLFYKAGTWPYKLENIPGPIGRRLRHEFSRVSMPELNSDLVRTVGAAEWFQRIAARLGLRELALTFDAWGNKTFVHHMARSIAENETALWGYDGSSFSCFAYAKKLGRPLILDRTIGDYRAYNALMDGLQDRFSEWFIPVERKIPADAIARDEEEYHLADHILVGCEYAAKTVREWSTSPGTAEKVRVLDYCYNASHYAGISAPAPVDRKAPVRFLYMGMVIPRKGIHHVLEAIAQLPPGEAELTIVGDMKVPPAAFARYADRVRYIPTVPRYQVAKLMAQHDVLLLPTYHEGAGIVLYEALASGMGIIQSDRASLVATPQTGIILDELSTDAVLEAMLVPIRDRDRLDGWKSSAQGAAEAYTFEKYRDNIGHFLAEVGL